MILWRTNLELDEAILDTVIEAIDGNPRRIGMKGMFTSFFADTVNEREEVVFASQYKKVIADGFHALGIQHRSGYSFDHWTQVYSDGNVGHTPHDHYKPHVIVSWVHFVRPTSTPAFHFLDSNYNKTYPEQNPGDFIMFNSWALHGVDPSKEYRAVIAGNVYLKDLVSPADIDISLHTHFEGDTFTQKQIKGML